MPATKTTKAVPLGRRELDEYCRAHAAVGLQTHRYTGGTQICEVWYLAHRNDKYLLVSTDNLEYDAHHGETIQLRGGERVIVNGELRKIQL